MKRHQHKYIGIIIIKLYKWQIFFKIIIKKKFFKNAWEQSQLILSFISISPSPFPFNVYVSLKNYAKNHNRKIFFWIMNRMELTQKNDEAYTLLLPFICYTTEMLQFRKCRCTFITMKEWMLIHKRFAWHNW